jgi:aerobic carbon-monoxide dehydrogenase large subunit
VFSTRALRSTSPTSSSASRPSGSHCNWRLRGKVFAIAANLLECAEVDLELRAGGVGVVGVPGAMVSLARIAQAARPGWDNQRAPGVDVGLEETFYWQPQTVTWSYAVHVAIVEVDRETGRVGIEKYTVAHDCGVVVNPLLVEGQIMGGAAQGLGGTRCEGIAYDTNGQLLSGSLLDYALLTACDIPAMQIIHQHSPSPLNPFGVKGVGEGGAVVPPAAIANAVCDALAPFGVEVNATPVNPEQLVRATRPR